MKPESETRQCGSCSACCQGWIKGAIRGVKLGLNNPCQHCTTDGCAIYASRPENPCVQFKCGWLTENSPLPDNLKPDACGAIVLLNRTWSGIPVNYVLPTGERVPHETLEIMMAFTRHHSVPMIYFENLRENGQFTGRKQLGYGPPSFTEAFNTCITPADTFFLD